METSEHTIKITRATMHDIALITPLFDAYRQFYGQETNPEETCEFLTARLRENSSVICLACKTDEVGKQHGCGFTQLYPSFSSVTMKPLWILNDLFVTPEARQGGIGRALLEHAKKFAETTQARGLTLQTAVDNHTAQALYEAAGWQREMEFYTYTLYL